MEDLQSLKNCFYIFIVIKRQYEGDLRTTMYVSIQKLKIDKIYIQLQLI
jgi:hypothetical protein